MIGFDLQEVAEIGDEDKLLKKIGLEGEIAYVQKFKQDKKQKVASLWAVKEAVFKALDVSAGDVSFKEIELCHKPSGAPFVQLYGKAKQRLEELNAERIEVSISHQKNVVGAIAMIVK